MKGTSADLHDNDATEICSGGNVFVKAGNEDLVLRNSDKNERL